MNIGEALKKAGGAIVGAPKKAVQGVAWALGVQYVLGQIAAVSRGELGPGAFKAYWALAGKKSITSLVVAAVGAGLAYAGLDEAAKALFLVAGLGVTAGVLDASYRAPGPPEGFKRSRIYGFLAAHSALVTLAFAAAAAYIKGGHCGHLDCATAQVILLVVAGIAGWAGLLDATWNATPPDKALAAAIAGVAPFPWPPAPKPPSATLPPAAR